MTTAYGRGNARRRLRCVEQTQQRGTADAVKAALGALKSFSGDVLILYGDVPLITTQTLKAFLRQHRSQRNSLTVMTAEFQEPKGYGRIVRNGQGHIQSVVEQIDADAKQRKIKEINTGLYLVNKTLLCRELPKIKKNQRKGEYYLTDLVDRAVKSGGSVGSYCVADAGEVMGINNRAELAAANCIIRDRINRDWMEKGVSLQDPETTYIDRSVRLAPDVVIGPGCSLRGSTQVKQGTRIDAGCVITDSRIGEDVHIKPYSVLEKSKLDAGVQVGPFAHLRPDSYLEKGARVGNFVELKKTRLGQGAKANHLSYLGNSKIGELTNIGAGTITCNYDGVNKFATKIGPRSFIGSDTQLVAPVSLGADSWIGAGSTITKDVPAGSLALTRVEQKNIKGWVARKSKRKKGK